MLNAGEMVKTHVKLYQAGVVDAGQRQAVIRKFELQGHPAHLSKAIAFIKANPGITDYAALNRYVVRLVVNAGAYGQYAV